MAKIATEVKQWLEDESAIVVLRFIGTSPDSSDITPLLRSIFIRLWKATGQDIPDIPEVTIKSLLLFQFEHEILLVVLARYLRECTNIICQA